MKITLLILVSLLLSAMLFFFGYQCGTDKITPAPGVETIVVIDTFYRDTIIYKPHPVSISRPQKNDISELPSISAKSFIYIPKDIDTTAVITDYFSQRVYTVPFSDSTFSAETDITISKNTIDVIGFRYKVYNTTTIIPERCKKYGISIGLGVNYTAPLDRPGIDAIVALDFNRNALQFRYDPINKTYSLGYTFKIVKF